MLWKELGLSTDCNGPDMRHFQNTAGTSHLCRVSMEIIRKVFMYDFQLVNKVAQKRNNSHPAYKLSRKQIIHVRIPDNGLGPPKTW